MRAHIVSDQAAIQPAILCWNLSPGDRGKLEGMAGVFGMRVIPVFPAEASCTVAELLSGKAKPAASAAANLPTTPAILMANFCERDFDTLLDLLRQAEVNIPLKAVATKTNRSWRFAELLQHLAAEHAAFHAQQPQ